MRYLYFIELCPLKICESYVHQKLLPSSAKTVILTIIRSNLRNQSSVIRASFQELRLLQIKVAICVYDLSLFKVFAPTFYINDSWQRILISQCFTIKGLTAVVSTLIHLKIHESELCSSIRQQNSIQKPQKLSRWFRLS